MEHDQEELLEVGSTSRRGRRAAGWILILAAALTQIALHASTGPAQDAAVPSTTPSGPIGTIPDSARPWATTPGACGADTLLPIGSSAPPAERSGIRVLLGGDRLRLVDFDSGPAMNLPDEVVRPGEYAAVLAGDLVTAYATTRSCNETAHYAMLRISVDHRLRFIRSLGPTESLLADRNRVWIVSFATDADHPYATITPVAGGQPVRLPAGFYPSAIVGDTTVGLLQANPSAPPSWLVLIDAHTGQVRARLERLVSPLAAGAGQIFWTSGCQADDATTCTLRLRAIAGGATTGYPLPHPPAAVSSALTARGSPSFSNEQRPTHASEATRSHPRTSR